MRLTTANLAATVILLLLTTFELSADELLVLLQRQQAQITELERRLGEHERMLRRLPSIEHTSASLDRISFSDLDFHGDGYCDCPTHHVGFDKGFFIRPYCPAATPFELKVNGRIQFRHTALDRHAPTYFHRPTGTLIPITQRNDFEVERGRLTFSGFVHDPSLQFYINLDLDTDDRHRAVAQDFWFNYEFGELINLFVGKAFIPGSRDWLSGALQMRFGDRSMATTFFRPDRTVGIWSIGELADDWHYRVMIGNGFQSADLIPREMDDRFLVSGSSWWEPLADFGAGHSDLAWHEELAIRVGSSFSYSSQEGNIDGTPSVEEAFVRLSDGARLTEIGALGPGVTVNHFDIYLLAFDIAGKYRGFSFDSEFFARWLNNVTADGPVPLSEIYTDGFYFDVGYMLCPGKFEINGRLSTVDGLFGDAWEYAAGLNIFMNGHNNKLTFDASYLDGSPITNTGTNYRVGDRGVMFRSAWQVAF